jgi:hypothetical protein
VPPLSVTDPITDVPVRCRHTGIRGAIEQVNRSRPCGPARSARRAALFRAIDFDSERGLSGNRISEMAFPAISRPVVQGYVAAKRLRAAAHAVLWEAGLDGSLGVGGGWT